MIFMRPLAPLRTVPHPAPGISPVKYYHAGHMRAYPVKENHAGHTRANWAPPRLPNDGMRATRVR
eukprot:6792541-Pyramimonas_sp.AAC.1